MIDHVSVGVSDLCKAVEFYTAIFAPLGISRIIDKPGSIGFGKKYPEFWVNQRDDIEVPGRDNGTHICLRAASVEAIDDFYRVAMALGASSSGAPGYRDEYRAPAYRDENYKGYYAAFIRDECQNHIEVVTFV